MNLQIKNNAFVARIVTLTTALMLAIGAQFAQTQPAAAQSGLSIKVISAGYEQWGRPVNGCGEFDDSHPMRKFNFTVRITNNTGKTLRAGDYSGAALVNDELVEWVCFYGQNGGGLPAIAPGQSKTVSFAAFVEQEQSVSVAAVVDRRKNVAYACFDEAQVVSCQ